MRREKRRQRIVSMLTAMAMAVSGFAALTVTAAGSGGDIICERPDDMSVELTDDSARISYQQINYNGVVYTGATVEFDVELAADTAFDYINFKIQKKSQDWEKGKSNVTLQSSDFTDKKAHVKYTYGGDDFTGGVSSVQIIPNNTAYRGTITITNFVVTNRSGGGDTPAPTSSPTTAPTEAPTDAPVGELVVQIGTTTYPNFKAAFETAKDGDIITLLADIELGKFRYAFEGGNPTDSIYKKDIDNVTIDGNGHSITGSEMFLFASGGNTITFKNITLSGGTTAVISAKGNSTINFENATVSAPAVKSNDKRAVINASGLNVKDAADGVKIVMADSVDKMGTVNIGLTDELAAKYIVEGGVLKAKQDVPATEKRGFTFVGTLNQLFGKTMQITVNGETKTGVIPEPTTVFTGDSNLALGIIIENVPVGATVTAVIID